MKTKKPRSKKFKDSYYTDYLTTVEVRDDLVCIDTNTSSPCTFLDPVKAMQLAEHIIHCALYVHEKYGKKE